MQLTRPSGIGCDEWLGDDIMTPTFTCDYCGCLWGGGFTSAEECEKHEKVCSLNPANKTCATCEHHDWPKTKEQHDKWEKYDSSENDYVADMGCHVFNDRTFRKQCHAHEKRQST